MFHNSVYLVKLFFLSIKNYLKLVHNILTKFMFFLTNFCYILSARINRHGFKSSISLVCCKLFPPIKFDTWIKIKSEFLFFFITTFDESFTSLRYYPCFCNLISLSLNVISIEVFCCIAMS